MHFLSWGDFSLPFQWSLFFAKHFYMWSFQSGTSNPDGLIRLPGRGPIFIVYGLFGNVAASYFYIFATLAIAFIAFFFFARKFLGIKQTSVQIIGALFFALNPIFLGNVAKIGLVLAAAMLPFCLLAIRATFQQQRFRYLLLYIVCLNISFLHPYTFAVNFVASVGYLAFMAWHNKTFVHDNIGKFVLIGVLGFMLNLYFVLPTLSMGTVSKDVISANITPVKTDYTALVDISNTGNIFTGFSLSKNVFVDFDFYNNTYQTIYFFGVFAFYVLLFWLYLRVEQTLNLSDKRRLGVLFTCFLLLVALATVSIVHLDAVIKLLIGMPGGWAFRSPLKWQLYIPLALFGILMVLLNRVPRGRRLWVIEVGLLATFLIMNAYIAIDIGKKILTPRTPGYFAELQATNLADKTLLFVNNGDCMNYLRNNPAVNTELNQVLGSQNVQVKHVIEDQADTVNLGSYNYILGCQDHMQDQLTHKYRFALSDSYGKNTFRLYTNTTPLTPVFATSNVFALDASQTVDSKYDFVNAVMGENLTTIEPGKNLLPSSSLADAFDNLTPTNIRGGLVGSTIAASGNERQLYIRPSDQPLYISQKQDTIAASNTPAKGLQLVTSKTTPLLLPKNHAVTIIVKDTNFTYKNLVPNPSLEQGLWQKNVGDCYNFDDKPAIGMRLNTAHTTNGKQSLELAAQNHIACTGPNAIPVDAGQHYLLSFDYQSDSGGKNAGYHLSFDDPLHTTMEERMVGENQGWKTYGREITAPKGATHLHLELYAYPDSYGRFTATARYDQVGLINIPPLQNRFYVSSRKTQPLKVPKNISYQLLNPTRTLVRVTSAKQPFYLGINQTYDKLWQLTIPGKKSVMEFPFAAHTTVPEANHIRLNDTTNGWYIDPTQLCAHASGCSKQTDGSYNFDIVAEFVPQRWFYFGGALSLLAAVLCGVYYWYDRKHGEIHKEGLWRWHK